MLGRENCQRFLRDWFVLPSTQKSHGNCPKGSNPLFRDWPQRALAEKSYESQSDFRKEHRQIIPLVGTAAVEQKLPSWPARKFGGYDELKSEIEKRVDTSYPLLANEFAEAFCRGTSTFSWLCRPAVRAAAWLAWKLQLKRKVRRKLKDWIDNARDEVDGRA